MIRLARTDDIDAIMKIEKSSFIPQIQELREVFEKRIIECPGLFLVAEDDKGVYGYLSAEYMKKAPETADELALGHTPGKNTTSSIIYISSFAILPERRGNGTGRQFWKDVDRHFNQSIKNATFYLLVNDVWKGARKIYEENGYRFVKTFPNFFPTEETDLFTDGILMRKN